MKESIREPGFYFFPGHDMSKAMSEAEEKAYAARIQAGTDGLVVIHPEGSDNMSPTQLLTELGTDVVAAFVAALCSPRFGRAISDGYSS